MCIFISIIHNKNIKVGFKKNIKYGGFIAVQLEQTIKVINWIMYLVLVAKYTHYLTLCWWNTT